MLQSLKPGLSLRQLMMFRHARLWPAILVAVFACAESATSPVTVRSLALSADSLVFSSLGDTLALRASATDDDGVRVSGASISWRSANTAVATVDERGLVTATGNGSTTITASVNDVRATAMVTVQQRATTIRLALGRGATYAGDSIAIMWQAFDARGSSILGTAELSSSDTTVAALTRDGRWVRARANGNTVVSAALDTVRAQATLQVQAVTAIAGLAVPDTLVIFRPYAIAPLAVLSGGDSVPLSLGALSSSDTGVLRVQPSSIRSRRLGVATLTARAAGFVTTRTVRSVAFEARPVHPTLARIDARALHRIPVIEIRVLPTRDGERLDSLASPEFSVLGGASLVQMQQRVDSTLIMAKDALETGSRYRGYADPASPPSITFDVRRSFTYYLVPPAAPQNTLTGSVRSYFINFGALFAQMGIVEAINREGAVQVWFTYGSWGANQPSVTPAPAGLDSTTSRIFSESAMSNADGLCVSNSFAADCQNLPRANHTYVLYGYNPMRGWSCAVHNHGHQFERIFGYFDRDALFWRRFVGRDDRGNFVTGRAGWTHMPPNTVGDYDYRNTALVPSDIGDWRPEGGTASLVNRATWEGAGYRYPDFDNCGGIWLQYWMQSFPGRDNTIAWNGRRLENWWHVYADFDRWRRESRSLVQGNGGTSLLEAGDAGAPALPVHGPATDYPAPPRGGPTRRP